jgi:hypothetical protein
VCVRAYVVSVHKCVYMILTSSMAIYIAACMPHMDRPTVASRVKVVQVAQVILSTHASTQRTQHVTHELLFVQPTYTRGQQQ